MGVLYPLMALGLFAGAVPVWVHLRRRDETNLVEFSTLRFLDDQPLARARPLWPRNWPLLLLRLLVLGLLVAAFMWPYVEDAQSVVVTESRVYILDNTLSHQLDDAFATARDHVADELAGHGVTTQIGVVELSSTARVIARFGDDAKTAAQQVRRLEPSATRGSYIDAFRTAAEMLTTTLGVERRIVLLSDSQANQWTLGEDSPPFLPAATIDLPEISEDPVSNLSLANPRARRLVRDGQHWIEAQVVIQKRGTATAPVVAFRSNGREVARVPVSFSESDRDDLRTVVATWQTTVDDWAVGEIQLLDTTDPLPGDDRVVYSLPPLRPGRVELLADSQFIRRALAPEVMLGRWEVHRPAAPSAAHGDDQPPDVLCLESNTLSSSVVRDRIRTDLAAGRGIILLVDGATPLIAGFLRELGIELESTETSSREPSRFRYVFAEHPVFLPFQTADFGDLTGVEFTNYRRLQVRGAVPLAFSSAGDPLVFEVDANPGRMLVFAFGFDRRDTNWPIHPTFIPFLDKCLTYVQGHSTTSSAYEPGESVTWSLPAGTVARPAVVTQLHPATRQASDAGPDPIRIEFRNGQASFQLPPQPGHYAVRFEDADRIEAILDVNPSPFESDLRFDAAPAALTAWRQTDTSPNVADTPDSQAGLALTTLEALQQQLWWYLLVAAVAAISLETILTPNPI